MNFGSCVPVRADELTIPSMRLPISSRIEKARASVPKSSSATRHPRTVPKCWICSWISRSHSEAQNVAEWPSTITREEDG